VCEIETPRTENTVSAKDIRLELKERHGMVLLSLIALISITTGGVEQAKYLSPQAIVASGDGNLLYIVQGGAKQIAVFDTSSAKVIETIDVPAKPTGLAISAMCSYLYVTCAEPKGRLCVIDTDTKTIIKQIPTGHGARSPVLSPDGNMLYVCNRFDNDVSVINTKDNKHVARINVLREPFAADITPDGKWLFVGNHLPEGPANAESVACKVSVINTKTLVIDVSISLPNGSMSLHGIAVSPDGRFVYVSHILARYTVPTSQLERGWINTNALSIIDVMNKELIETVLLDDVDNGAANPWAVSCTADGKYICVTHAGTHELSIIDATALLEKIRNYRANEKRTQQESNIQYIFDSYGSTSSSNIPNELSFLYGIRQRIKLCGKGPRAIAIAGSNVYVAEYFTDSITLIDINKKPVPKTIALPLGPAPQMTRRRRGEMLFNDASICFQRWQTLLRSMSTSSRSNRFRALIWQTANSAGRPDEGERYLTRQAALRAIRDHCTRICRNTMWEQARIWIRA